MVSVAEPVATTAGRPNSRAMMAGWLSGPPLSQTTAPIDANTMHHAGEVVGQTRTSPGSRRTKSSSSLTTLAVPS